MTVEGIIEEIGHLPESERKRLFDRIDEMKEEAWDREMERDFAPGGRGEALPAKVEADIAAGNFGRSCTAGANRAPRASLR
jgi:hypothetical protein